MGTRTSKPSDGLPETAKPTDHRISALPAPPTVDRISALPQPIIHHMLSFLPNKDVKVASSLSKTWFHICTTFPFLDFDFDYHRCPFPPPHFVPYDCEQYAEMYLKHITKALQRFHNHDEHNLKIRRLTLPITFTTEVAPLLDSWISLVLQHEVEEFNLKITNLDQRNHGAFYDLPRSVLLAAKSIKAATLYSCSLLQYYPFPPNNDQNIISGSGGCSNLLKLHLCNVLFYEPCLSSIFSSCPLIEELAIYEFIGAKCLSISNLNKLKTLEISHWGETVVVEMNVPSLQSLDIYGSFSIRLLECPKLTHLNLDSVRLGDFRLQDFLSRLSFLRSLKLANIYSLTKLKISNDTLKEIRIYDCRCHELNVDAPNLVSRHINLRPRPPTRV